MKRNYHYIPFKGIDDLYFGMSINEVRNKNRSYKSHYCGFPNRNHILDVYKNYQCYFTPSGRLEAIELFEGEISINNVVLHIDKNLDSFLSEIEELHCEIKYLDIDESYVCPSIGLMMFCPNGVLEDVLLYSEHYFDEENQYLLEHFGVPKF